MKLGAFDIEKGRSEGSVIKDSAFGKRHHQVILLFFLITVTSCTRLNLSVGLDAMTDSSFSDNPNIPTFNWDNRRVIQTSFYFSFGILQVFGAQMGRTYGIKWLLTASMLINSVACIIIPPMACHFGSTGVIVCRVIQGLAQGFFYPFIHSLIGQWIPPTERLRCAVLAQSGTPFSNIIAILTNTYVSSTSYGWPFSFYLFGALGCLWIIPWILFGYNSPEEHTSISEDEKMLIEKSLGVDETTKLVKTPWKQIFKSLPVWAAIIAYLGQTWGNIIIQTEIPTFMVEIMKVDVSSNSLLASAPYAATFVMSFMFCYVAHYLIVNKYVTKLFARKLFTTIGMVVPAIVVLVLGSLPKDSKISSYLLYILAAGASSAMYSGHGANVFDISPTFPGIIKGMSNSISNIFNILPPFTVGIIVTDEADQHYWMIIFLMSTSFYISTNIFYFVFASGDLESWDPTCQKLQNTNSEKQEAI